MALSPKDQERIIEEEKLRYQVRQDLQARSCAQHPRRGRWIWIVALLGLAWVLWHHNRCCGREMACHHGYGMMGGMSCMHHGMMGMGDEGMAPPPDGAPTDEANPAAPAAAKPAAKAAAKK